MPDLPLIPGTLAQDCYPASAEAFYTEMFARGHAVAPDIAGILIQDAAPDPSARGVMGWIPTAGGVPIYPGFVFVWHSVVGHWVSRNPIAPSDDSRRPYVGGSASIDTYDGGAVGVVGIATGPMWEIDTAFAGSVPIGVGLIPGSSPAATILAPKATQDDLGHSGEAQHVLTGAEGAVEDHVHPMGFGDTGSGSLGLSFVTPDITTPSYTTFFNAGAGPSGTTIALANLVTLKANNGNGVVSNGHNNVQPFYGVFFLKRTARQFYLAG